ncbi:uncharacterized protein LOC127845146 isoform X2 [Dreissena polymorpha]|uniref:uncharacterized protein LOC127845146 isoform X2 n=1 Tax=Dreissena polymorpha TaxID=45954 RepID=UPI002264A345|nr:uncharacterized protein LOC127845146 isoform X2 [Dreissena polymorpha]
MAECIEKLGSKISLDDELLVLQELHSTLVQSTDCSALTEDGASIPLFGHGNPYPHRSLETVCKSQETLDKFTCYVFERRFGWSETDTEDGHRVRHLSSTGTTLSAGTSKQKSALNTMLDCLLKWFLHQKITVPNLQSMIHTIKKAANMPVVRNRAVIHAMDLCKLNQDSLCDQTLYQAFHELVIMSLTDVWSAIRNATASRLSPVVTALHVEHVQHIFNSLVQICEDHSTWQMKEGAIMGINAVLQTFHKRLSSKSPMSSPRSLVMDPEEKPMPGFISEKIHSVVFNLLAHSQLSVREHAAKTLATYVTCSDISVALSTLNEVVQVLRRGTKNREVPITIVTLLQVLPGQFVDDYAAEGFLAVCIFLIKVIPLCQLLSRWPEYISTFLLYLSHPASTVRQAASSVFKYLVVKGSHSVVVLKLVLQALSLGWIPDTEVMTQEATPSTTTVGKPFPSVTKYSGSNLSDTWEGREGRLFAYELIFRYLIKNHWLYTFGPAGPPFHSDANSGKDGQDKLSDSYSQLSSTPKEATSMHHVESDKSFEHVRRKRFHQIRFLTQTDLSVEEHAGNAPEQTPDRVPTTNHDIGPANHSNSNHNAAPTLSQSGIVGSSHFEHSSSLLTQAQVLDNGPLGSHLGLDGSDRQHWQVLQLQQLLEDNNNKSVAVAQCGWMEREPVQDMLCILRGVLYQTAESLGHSQWELRRIANQVLPCLAEVIRWYDINLLVSLWNSYLNVAMPTCLMTFTSVLILKESVIHAVKLMALMHKPPHSWQDHAACGEHLSTITGTIQGRVGAYLELLCQLVRRPCCDRLSILATDVLLMAYEHLRVPAERKLDHLHSVLYMWKSVFTAAHPQSRLSPDLLAIPGHSRAFSSPLEGYLSCCLVKPENATQCAKQVEKQLISEIHHRIPELLSSLSVRDCFSVLPIVTHYVGQFVEDSHISKVLLECVQGQASRVVESFASETDRDSKLFCGKCILATLRELSAVITLKSVDIPHVQKILVVYEELCAPVSLSQHLAILLSGIAARINETVEFSVDQPCDRVGGAEEDLLLLSNDIPNESPQSESTDSEEELTHVPGSPGSRFPESLTLNTSNNSGSLTGRLSSLSHQSGAREGGDGGSTPRGGGGSDSEEEESSSDWDSWDDEDESQSAFGSVFTNFLNTLQKSNSSDFLLEMKQLPGKQRMIINNLLKC